LISEADSVLLLFAYRRKIVKELGYDERGKPGVRAKLKALKWGQQGGKPTAETVRESTCFGGVCNEPEEEPG
jgi:hypothetical protein